MLAITVFNRFIYRHFVSPLCPVLFCESKNGGFGQNDMWPFLQSVNILSFSGVPPFGDIVSCGFFDGADMSIQPKNIKSSTGPEVFVTPYIMSENVPIESCAMTPLPIMT